MTMNPRRHPVTILMADDDDDDRMVTRKALAHNRLANDVRFVVDGVDLMDYLHQRGQYSEPGTAPRPGLILLDLNMPRKDGREALAEIKKDAALRSIPVVILTTSKAEEDILRTYDLGVNSFITKPVSFDQLSAVIAAIGQYWLEIVELPTCPHQARAA
jgi:CheY-like chemotaxis protein